MGVTPPDQSRVWHRTGPKHPRVRIRSVPDVLIYGDTIRSPELRHEVPVPIPGSVPLRGEGRPADRGPPLPRDSRASARTRPSWRSSPRAARVGRALLARPAGLGGHARARRSGLPRARDRAGDGARHFPIGHADHLRANGIELAVERDLFDNRRRAKNETELRGIRNAQRACEAALDASRELLRRAQPNGAGLEVDGEPLDLRTAEARPSRTSSPITRSRAAT